MNPITLTLKERPKVPLEAETVTPDAFVTMSNEQIRSSLVYHGKRHCSLRRAGRRFRLPHFLPG